ncbi:MAG TPA: SPASM domain-containing protein, partial [Thermoanaerobaculia bacterium]|nr:SPASM domain-containing protein [Thermoanaerobaculia bacterium]
MLKAYLRRFRDVLTTPRPSRESIEAAFRGFVAVDGNRGALMSSLADDVRVVRAAHGRWLTGGADRDFAKTLLDACAAIDDGNVWHDELKFRSYVDVSIQVKALRALIGLLDMGDPLDATTLLLAHDPSSRPALLVHAELQLERGDAGGAIETVRRALRVQAVCTTAQAMLFRAYAAARAQGSAAPELEALDYDLSDKFCRIPFTHFSTGVEGKTFACTCPSWVPFPIGNVLEAESAEAIWNSDVAMEIRRSILDGDFAYCSRTQCSYISARKLPRKSEITNPQWRAYIDNRVTRVEAAPLMVELNHDPTCNLACPSCRTEIVSANAQQIDRYAAASE